MYMSAKLRWCLGFIKAGKLREHKDAKVRKKNIHRVDRMINKAFRRWKGIPLPPEWFNLHPKGYKED